MMASFKDLFSKCASDGTPLNKTTYQTSSGQLTVTNNSDGTYHVYSTTDGTVQHNIDPATLQSILSGALTFGEPLTDSERKELSNLQEEKQKWIRQQRLKGFQKLPAHLRQEIVDEAYLKDCVNEMNSVDETKFDDNDRLNELEQKENNSNLHTYIGQPSFHQPQFGNNNWHISHVGPDSYQPIDQMVFRYGKIINEFSTEELAEAHAAATLEESL